MYYLNSNSMESTSFSGGRCPLLTLGCVLSRISCVKLSVLFTSSSGSSLACRLKHSRRRALYLSLTALDVGHLAIKCTLHSGSVLQSVQIEFTAY
ncbi:hypothetical protein DPMN_182387 [Dreissena polymorpha]|uniref:Uncharacterized protein n=1 Tax=Dreissena polymorpha TaxID=45954 RepID=A0A9D4DFD3_DREPO|nr:hypothetical protein DPMN_182387 [Dreissena polymorpha]